MRQRHDLPRGDLDRVVRQQVVMASLAHQVISGKTLSSPATLNQLQEAVQRSVVLSDGWDVMQFAEQLQKLINGLKQLKRKRRSSSRPVPAAS